MPTSFRYYRCGKRFLVKVTACSDPYMGTSYSATLIDKETGEKHVLDDVLYLDGALRGVKVHSTTRGVELIVFLHDHRRGIRYLLIHDTVNNRYHAEACEEISESEYERELSEAEQ